MNPFENETCSKEEFNGFWIPRHNVKVMKKGIEENTAPFLPDECGNIKAETIYNYASGYPLPANRMFPCLFEKIDKGYKSNIVITRTALTNNGLKYGEKGIFYNFKDETGEIHTSCYYFPEQTERPEEFTEAKDRYHYDNSLSDVSMVIASSDPVEYFACYLTAGKCNMKLSVDPVIAEEFKKKLMKHLENDLLEPERKKKMDSLQNILFDAEKRSGEYIRTLKNKE